MVEVGGPEVGVTVMEAGGGVTVKLEELIAVPEALVTLIGPVVAAAGTVVLIWFAEITV